MKWKVQIYRGIISKVAIFVMLLLLGAISVNGQVSSRVAGMEGNPKYMYLLLQERQLRNSEDSIVRIIGDTRKLFASESVDKTNYGKEILRLEDELFDMRNRIGVVVGQIGEAEQNFIIEGLTNGTKPEDNVAVKSPMDSVPRSHMKNLVLNDYFKENLTIKSVYDDLIHSQKLETVPPTLLRTYMLNYKRLETLRNQYATASRDTAKSLEAQFNTVADLNVMTADSLAKIWGFIYDNKVYTYNFILDKLNQSKLLSEFELQYRETNQLIASVRDKVASEIMYGYPLQKKLILSYEVRLSNILDYTESGDSLSKVLAVVDTVSFKIPKIALPERIFIEYGDIKTSAPTKYNAANPIPENEVFDKGTVYKIEVGTFIRPQAVSIFRGVYPLCYEKTEDSRYRYFAGAFKELSQAEAAVLQLKKLGFKRPIIDVWRDGVFESLSESSDDKQTNVPSELYRVEISGDSENLSDIIKEHVDKVAVGKELSRVAVPDGGYIYTVGTFETKEAAEQLLEVLSQIEGVTSKILLIE